MPSCQPKDRGGQEGYGGRGGEGVDECEVREKALREGEGGRRVMRVGRVGQQRECDVFGDVGG